MPVDSSRADDECLCYHAICVTICYQTEHLSLPVRKEIESIPGMRNVLLKLVHHLVARCVHGAQAHFRRGNTALACFSYIPILSPFRLEPRGLVFKGYENYPSSFARPQFTDRIAWGALAKRLGTLDEEAFSGWMMTSAGRFALVKRYCRPTVCAARLQLREKQPSSLQVWRLKPFGEPGVHVLKSTPGVGGSILCDPQARQAHRRTEFQRPGLL